MAELLHQSDADPIGFGEIVAIVGELYLVILAVLVLLAAVADVAGLPGGFIAIGDPATAATFTA